MGFNYMGIINARWWDFSWDFNRIVTGIPREIHGISGSLDVILVAHGNIYCPSSNLNQLDIMTFGCD